MGQRFATALVSLLILVITVLVGGPDNLPRTLSTEGVLEVLAPAGLMLATLFNTLGAINTRVALGEFQPGDLIGLTRSREFWVSAVAAFVTGLQLAGIRVIDETEQTLAVDFLLMATTGLTRSWGMRPSGTVITTMIAPPER